MNRLIAVFMLFALPAMAVYEVGDKPGNTCWKDSTDSTICLDDAGMKDKVRVLLFNAGWCPPCNTEFSTIASGTKEFAGKDVVFISLSAEGWSHGSPPNKKFLGEWMTKHKLDTAAATFHVAASPRNAGNDYFTDARIPSAVILKADGSISYKSISPGVSTIASKVRTLLGTTRPKP